MWGLEVWGVGYFSFSLQDSYHPGPRVLFFGGLCLLIGKLRSVGCLEVLPDFKVLIALCSCLSFLQARFRIY